MTTIASEQLDSADRHFEEGEPETTFDAHLVELPADPTTEQLMRTVEASGTLDFWDDPREDIYTVEDGEPL